MTENKLRNPLSLQILHISTTENIKLSTESSFQSQVLVKNNQSPRIVKQESVFTRVTKCLIESKVKFYILEKKVHHINNCIINETNCDQ